MNADGYPDVYVSNDYISNDLLYINQQDGSFRNEADRYLSYSSKFSMGNDMADVNNDGLPDIMTLDMLPEVYSRKKQTINGFSYQFYVNDDKYGYQHQYVRNMLHLHNGLRGEELIPYSEVGQMMGIFQTEWSWSPLFADYDNDGDRDLLITNGFPKDLTDKDFTNYKAQMYGYLATEEQVLRRIPEVKVPNYAYEQTGPLSFTDRTAEWGMDIPSYSNGASFVDLDNDGDLDYVTNNIDDPAFVFRNTTSDQHQQNRHFLRLVLKGSGNNTAAIGAKVACHAGETIIYDQHFLTRGYISSVEPVVHLGLGTATMVDSLVVIWPGNRHITVLTNVEADQALTLKEEDARPFDRPGRSESEAVFSLLEDPWGYEHNQTDYIDFFQNQRIIPHKFSQIGPCMAQGDLNGDGKEDIIIGATNLIPTTVYLQTEDGFELGELPGLTDQKVCSEADLLVMDIDEDGDQDVLAIGGGYEFSADSRYPHFLYEQVEPGIFTQQELSIPGFSASVVVAEDIDQDGDRDLFIGARVKRNSYPEAPASHILVNEGGSFAPLSDDGYSLGMVTDAVWSDVDGDGWTDLLIAREWNSLVFLRNDQGNGFAEVPSPELDEKTGLWASISAVDLDGDGDDDYVAGNLGVNHRFNISEDFPMRLYAIDIDNNGTVDPISTAYWEDDLGQMTEYPINYLDELAAQSPFFRNRFTSYTEFSTTDFPQIINPDQISSEVISTVNSTQSAILWNDGGTFRWEVLPAEAQVAPIRETLVRDFTGDGHPDILLAGNDHTWDVGTGYYDANRGLLLVAGGDGSTPSLMSAQENGLQISGQVGSLLYIEGEPSLLLVGINRKALQVYRQVKE